MRFFNLPDLGEGIPEADIVEWHIKEGDTVKEDQIIVSVETAKAIVEVPAPCDGVIAKLFGQEGDTILTGEPLVEFVSDQEDAGTVVGKLVQDEQGADEEPFFIGAAPESAATPSNPVANIQALAQQMNMDLGGLPRARKTSSANETKSYSLENPEPLKGVRKHMARTMAESHTAVVPVTLFDDVDIHHWSDKEDITVRLIKAITEACKKRTGS